MRKKIISALLLGLFTVASTSTFVSCKDYDDDISNIQDQVKDQNTLINTLKEKLSAAESAVTALQNADVKINEEIEKLQNADKDFLKKTDAAETYATKKLVADTKAELEQAIADAKKAAKDGDAATLVAAETKISSAIETAKAELNAAINLKANQSDLEAAQEQLSGVSAKLNTLSDNYTKFIGEYASLKAALDAQKAALESDYAKKIAEGNEATLAAAKKEVSDLQTTINTAMTNLEVKLKGEIKAVQDKVTEDLDGINTTIGQLKAAHDGFATKEQFTGLSNQLTTLVNQKIPAVENSITKLETKLDAKINVVNAALAKALRSLVFQPDLYVDGIEAFEYPFRIDTTLVKVNVNEYDRDPRTGETVKHKISKADDYQYTTDSKTLVTPLAWPVEYHANPSTTDTKFENIKGFAVREAEVISRGASSVKFNAVEKYLDGTQLFSNQNGIITVGIQVADADKSKFVDARGNIIKGAVATGTDYITALQSYSSCEGKVGKDTVITSDYAMLYPEKMWLEGIVWTKPLKKTTVNNDETGNAQATGKHNAQTATLTGCEKKVHVWDTPKEALAEQSADAVQLYYNDKEGIKLEQYLGVHMVRETQLKSKKTIAEPATVNLTDKELGQYGLEYEFDLVYYLIDSNRTSDSKFCNLDSKTGNIIAQNVTANEGAGEQSLTSVGREPLVRVVVKDIKSGKVLKDGYILVHITKEAPADAEKKAQTIDDFTKFTHHFTLCAGFTSDKTKWSEFNAYVLTDGLDNLEKEAFDKQYKIDAPSTTGDEYEVNHYTETAAKDNATKNTVGTVMYVPNADNTTNHAFYIKLSADELEALTHDGKLTDGKTTYTTYARYKKIPGSAAAYDYVYIKLTVELSRANVDKFGIKEKNPNYWYALNGNDAGFDAFVFNCNSPLNGGSIESWSRNILDNFIGNNVILTDVTGASHKFYFTPQTKEVVETDPVTGNTTTWIITPQKSSTDTDYKMLWPVYETDAKKHEWVSEENANEWINKCAISYDNGVYANRTLYAHKSGSTTFTKIATLTPSSGEITLVMNEVSKSIINAIAYEADHKNIDKEFRAQVGVIATKGCTALQAIGSTFLASWQRPINPADAQQVKRFDAKTNADTIYVADIVKLFDFRGPTQGDMDSKANKWLWAYYGVKSITVDCTPSKVKTNMGKAVSQENMFADMTNYLGNVTKKARLKAWNGTSEVSEAATVSFDLSQYNKAEKSEELYNLFNGEAKDKKKFGYIIYYNNGDNVTCFAVRLPISIEYTWGTIKTYVTIGIDRTLGN